MLSRLFVGAALLALECVCCLVTSAAADAGTSISTFPELEKAVDADTEAISVTGPEIAFPYQLEVREGTAVSIESTAVRATLDGRGSTRLFFLRTNSTLSLRRVALVRGRVDACSRADVSLECGGGAILIKSGGELLLHSVNISTSGANNCVHTGLPLL